MTPLFKLCTLYHDINYNVKGKGKGTGSGNGKWERERARIRGCFVGGGFWGVFPGVGLKITKYVIQVTKFVIGAVKNLGRDNAAQF